jgi:predicted ATPase
MLLSLSVLLQRMDSAIPLLTGGGADRPERQQTLRATIKWSVQLLDRDGLAAFRRLGVFRGSFDLEVAAAVAGGEP